MSSYKDIVRLRRRSTEVIKGHLIENTTVYKWYKVFNWYGGSTLVIRDDCEKFVHISGNCRRHHFNIERK